MDDNSEFTSQNLYGTWEKSQFNPELQLFNVNAFIFKEDGTFEIRGSYRQQDVQIDLGYYSLSTGNYVLNGNKLIFSNLTYFILPPDSDQIYVLLEELIELVPEEGNEMNSFQVEISTNSGKNELTIDYGPCAPNELCLGPQTFYKVRR
ncbi:hypothetical protein [Shivajiella indica]|uniref:Lipocalin-like domain-containing protein n=1 Tax=Shivajiella indica TaxID=872115 RepID=A0ABW5B8C5_9BACT